VEAALTYRHAGASRRRFCQVLRGPHRGAPAADRRRSRSLWREDGGALYVVKDAEAQRRPAKKPAIGRAPPGAQAPFIGSLGDLEADASSPKGGGSAEGRDLTRRTCRVCPQRRSRRLALSTVSTILEILGDVGKCLCRAELIMLTFQPFLRF